jgi:ribonuclease P protein component
MLGAPRGANVWPSEASGPIFSVARLPPAACRAPPTAVAGLRLKSPLGAKPRGGVQRLVNKADFERLLTTRSSLRSAHFALHHVVGSPLLRQWSAKAERAEDLSTGTAPISPQPVDDLLPSSPDGAADRPSPGLPALWLGCVVPKRHARRAVTRSLLKRQVRGAFERHAQALPAGLWLVRLRAPFATSEFVSARSQALALAARHELDSLLARAGV